MNEHIMNMLLSHNQKYEDYFSTFPYKTDPVAVFQYEQQFYIAPLIEKLIPLLYDDIKIKNAENFKSNILHDGSHTNTNTNNINKEKKNNLFTTQNLTHDVPDFIANYPDIKRYLKLVKDKYHNTILKELNRYHKNKENADRILSKEIITNFTNSLLEYNQKTDEEKKKFLHAFIEKNKTNFINLAFHNPELCIKTIANLRNPKAQYILLNTESSILKTLSQYIENTHTESLEKFTQLLSIYFMYPLETEVESYYKKWIGKEKIHIKFCSALMTNSIDSYIYAKKNLKNLYKKEKNLDLSSFTAVNAKSRMDN